MSFFSVGSLPKSWSRSGPGSGSSAHHSRRCGDGDEEHHDDIDIDIDHADDHAEDEDLDLDLEGNDHLDLLPGNAEDDGHHPHDNALRKPSIVDLGGVNSIRSFARSWQRAAAFPEAIPHSPSFVLVHDDEDGHLPPHGRLDAAGSEAQRDDALFDDRRGETWRAPGWELAGPRSGSFSGGGASLLRRHLEEARQATAARAASDAAAGLVGDAIDIESAAVDFCERERKPYEAESAATRRRSRSPLLLSSSPRYLSASSRVAGSYLSRHGGSYGTITSSSVSSSSRPRPRRSIEIVFPPGATSTGPPAAIAAAIGSGSGGTALTHDEREPILLHGVSHDGKIVVLAVEGRSTLPQTVFNSSNALIGIGLLSLPLAFRYSGWVLGLTMLAACAAVTAHTSRLLARCMRPHPAVLSFADLAYVCFGDRVRVLTSAVFSAELTAANVALLVLFADSLDLLFPGVLSLTRWKLVCAAVLFPLHFLPMRMLGYTSAVGIMATFLVVLIVVVDGLAKPDAPGSLLSPAATRLFPENWRALPLAYGLFLSPFAAHSVLPNIYRDMRHPHKYPKAIRITFSFTFLVDLTMAVVGLLMFGDAVREEITSNIIESASNYPPALTYAMCAFIAVVPLTKVPLNSRPLVTSTEVALGLCPLPVVAADGDADGDDALRLLVAQQQLWLGVARALVRAGILALVVAISILFPAFDSILSLMGSLFCAIISVILPFAFYLKMFDKEISRRERVVSWLVIVVFGIGSILGTGFTIVPKSVLGIES